MNLTVLLSGSSVARTSEKPREPFLFDGGGQIDVITRIILIVAFVRNYPSRDEEIRKSAVMNTPSDKAGDRIGFDAFSY